MSYTRQIRRIMKTNPRVVGFSATLKDELVRGKPSGRQAIRVYVTRKVPLKQLAPDERLPDEIDGIPVDVVAVGEPQPGEALPRSTRYRPLLGGASTIERHYLAASGTIGYFLVGPPQVPTQSPPYDWYILSNAHVLEPGLGGAAMTHEVIQPGAGDGGVFPDDTVGVETEFTYDRVDAAVARIDTGAKGEIIGLPAPRGYKRPREGRVVAKSGRTTGVTYGVIEDADAEWRVNYGPGVPGASVKTFRRVILVRGQARPFADRGDSGSLLIDPVDERAVGLVFSMSFSNGTPILTAAHRLSAVLRAFPNRRLVAPGASYPF